MALTSGWRLTVGCVVLCGITAAGEFDIRDEAAFAKIVAKDAKVEKLAGGMKFVEGPVWIAADGGYLVFSDIPSDELKKWTPKDGLSTFRKPSRQTNGNTLSLDGLLLSCEHGSRTLTRTEKDGSITVMAERYDGKKLNSPNDLAVKSDGTIWFTDPTYGITKEQKEQPNNHVFRLDPRTKELKAVADDFNMPNGIAFSSDEKKLYVADSGAPHHIRAFDVKDDGTLANGAVFCVIDQGAPDGIRCDSEGRLFSSAKDGVHVFMPQGRLIGKILVPESPANLCFGGDDGKTLFITARTSLYAIKLLVTGLRKP